MSNPIHGKPSAEWISGVVPKKELPKEADKIRQAVGWVFTRTSESAEEGKISIKRHVKEHNIEKQKKTLRMLNERLDEVCKSEKTFNEGINLLEEKVLPSLVEDFRENILQNEKPLGKEAEKAIRQSRPRLSPLSGRNKELVQFATEFKKELDKLYEMYKKEEFGLFEQSSALYERLAAKKAESLKQKHFKKELFEALENYLAPLQGFLAAHKIYNDLADGGTQFFNNFYNRLDREVGKADIPSSHLEPKIWSKESKEKLKRAEELVGETQKAVLDKKEAFFKILQDNFGPYTRFLGGRIIAADQLMKAMARTDIKIKGGEAERQIGNPVILGQRGPRFGLFLNDIFEDVEKLTGETSTTLKDTFENHLNNLKV